MSATINTPLTDAPLAAYDLGIVPYLPIQQLQRSLRSAVVAGETPGVLLLLEHAPVITVGAHGSLADIIAPETAAVRGMQIVRSERGGQCTLHAPGQLVAYPVMPIPRRHLRAYVLGLEEVLIRLLAGEDISANRHPGYPGLYSDGLKIASLGLRCERGVASHGSALNVSIDLSLYDLVISCGDTGLRQTSMRQITGRSFDMQDLKRRYAALFAEVFGLAVRPLSPMPTAGFEPAAPGSGGQCSIP